MQIMTSATVIVYVCTASDVSYCYRCSDVCLFVCMLVT